MHADDYRMISTGVGERVRMIMRSALDPYAGNSRAELAAALDDAGITDPAERQAINDHVVTLVGQARDPAADRFGLAGQADDLALKVMKARQADDRLVPAEPEVRDDVGDVVDRVSHPHESAEQTAQRRADDAERERLARLGVRPSLSADAIADQIIAGG